MLRARRAGYAMLTAGTVNAKHIAWKVIALRPFMPEGIRLATCSEGQLGIVILVIPY